jgi:hypothetical protein
VTLVEALTQQLPGQTDARQAPALPETLPAEFIPVVRACLQPDPRRRATLADIVALLRRPDPAPAPRPVTQPKAGGRRRAVVLVGGVAVAMAAIFAAPRILHRSGSSPAVETPAIPPESKPQPANAAPVPPAPKPQPVLPASQPIAQESGGEEPGAPGAASSPAPLPSSIPPGVRVDNGHKRAIRKAAPGGNPDEGIRPAAGQAHVLSQVLPDLPEKARKTIRGKVTITVRASVDPSGHVASAGLEPGPSRYIANLTLQAARQWIFEPAKAGGRDVASEWLLQFEITRQGTVVSPSRVAP